MVSVPFAIASKRTQTSFVYSTGRIQRTQPESNHGVRLVYTEWRGRYC
ncbi:hypothetical protein H6F78_04115 [Coleofasciculus sp. FACHB-64]|nr:MULTISPECIES: hypothetical protein [unclassified Coleofasciculus]MBD1837292.1 hypothetical protein [Coleofasciculus sp. FACHB-501]MBD2044824.1 hypothetical protein [Coleofasciculus sp. FACHB-64]